MLKRTEEFTLEDFKDKDLLVYDPFYDKRINIPIRRGGTTYNVSLIDMNEKPFHPDWTVICVHGWGSNALNYRFVLKYLSPYYRVIAYDLKGHGESDKDEDTYDLGLFTEELAQIINHFNPNNLVLIGHSMGTAIVMNYVYLNPRKIKAIALVSSSADFEKPLPRIVPLVFSKVDERLKNALIHTGMALCVTKDCPKILLDILREQNKRTPYEVYRKALLNTIYPWKKDEDLNKIKEPTLIMVGDKDIVTPVSNSEKLNKLIPNSRLLIIPNAGHSVLIEKGKHAALLLLEFVEFIREQEQAKQKEERKE
ncbi:MAG: alpha/beta fold hydrolase [Candidatus Heimdallarchaeaceae archaeon]